VIASSIFIVPNGTFIVELVAFFVVLAFVGKYLMPRINAALAARQDAIAAELAAADRAKEQAEQEAEERRAVLEQARAQARGIVEQAQHTADRLAEEARARGQREYDERVSSAEAEVHLARQRALEEAAQRLGQLVVEVVERIIGREVDAEAHNDLIDEAVRALAGDAGSPPAAAAATADGDL
jgi:F-type H+-transporting ATPase subunit b